VRLEGAAPPEISTTRIEMEKQTSSTSLMKGIFTAIYTVPSLETARQWYSEAFGIAPYFDEPFYVGFDVAGFELGLLPSGGRGQPGPGGVVAYWGVDDAHATFTRLLGLGATAHAPVSDVGSGILIGSVTDPFGNVVGVIQNPHFRR
jgi:predicted enzyme related to lactoylglutathione lyase